MNNARAFLDRRAEPRVSVNARGRIMHGEKLGIWADCLIKDLSDSGAKIELSHLHKVPPRFILIHFQAGMAFEVVLKWRRGDLAGMAFEVKHDLEQPVPQRLEAVRAAWLALR
ncbi:PilZ domain-containing protein [Phenylobacterium sp.]|uniref:PilZ domain-containing protein n=1 Tax=Phenylobacterium sp. TaxID=1871053 RepID=UPI0025D9EA4F|nr:PilZ domain-containing protein [Phenylobacterium sp.]